MRDGKEVLNRFFCRRADCRCAEYAFLLCVGMYARCLPEAARKKPKRGVKAPSVLVFATACKIGFPQIGRGKGSRSDLPDDVSVKLSLNLAEIGSDPEKADAERKNRKQ